MLGIIQVQIKRLSNYRKNRKAVRQQEDFIDIKCGTIAI